MYKGRVLNLFLEKVRLPNGQTAELEIIRHPGAAAVVPVREDGRVVIIRQHRHAAGGMIFEIPAGRLETGETPLDGARRELAEEAGFEASRWDALGWIWTTPGFTDEKIHLFLARGLSPVSAAHEPDEVIETADRSMEEAVAMIRGGEIRDAKTICGLMLAYFQLNATGGGL